MGTYAREKNRSLKYTVLWSIITGPTLRKQKKIYAKEVYWQKYTRTALKLYLTPTPQWNYEIRPFSGGQCLLPDIQLYSTDFRWIWLEDFTTLFYFTFKSPTNNSTEVPCRMMQRSHSEFFLLEFPKSKYSPRFLDSSLDILDLLVQYCLLLNRILQNQMHNF